MTRCSARWTKGRSRGGSGRNREDMTGTAEIRTDMVSQADWAINNAPSISYQEARPMPIHIPVHHLPFTTDCSGFVTMMAKWGGAPDPNGLGYDGYGFTVTL